MRLALAGLAASAVTIAAAWAWLGSPVAMPQAPLQPGEKIYCVSYAPFQGRQTPLDPSTMIPAAQIERDLAQLSRITGCVRVYSTDFGLDQIAGIAGRFGMKVIQGLWISGNREKSKEQVESAIALANRYPTTIIAVVVGNEVLLRGEVGAAELAATMRAVKSKVAVPVTYADVWEFWLRHPDVAAAADFITIHVLPYWEDFPIAAGQAAAHVGEIRKRMVRAFPGKEILIGEVGWPSAGRMREGALPSPANQARVVQDVVALAKREGFRVNLIEAYDAPWKRALEGTVGGHWGLIDDDRRVKFAWGEAVSSHPYWRRQAAGGIAFAIMVFAAGFAVALVTGRRPPPAVWAAVTVNGIIGGILIGWTVENVPVESLGAAGWLRSLALAAVAIAAPVLSSAALVRGISLPPLARLLGPAGERMHDPLALAVGATLAVTLVLAIHVVLGLVFDPRYKDFPFAPLTAAVIPLLVHGLGLPSGNGGRGAAELAGAAVLALSVVYIVPNEGFANWQSLWTCAALAALALTLARVRGARG